MYKGLGTALIVLKLLGVIDWSWWIVLLPIWLAIDLECLEVVIKANI